MSVFLTEGRKMAPHNKRKVKSSHPWLAGRPRNASKPGPHIPNPAHVTGIADEGVMYRDPLMAAGCYVKRPYT